MQCIFCQIVNRKINANIIAENEGAIAFLDIQPISDGHTIVIPKEHFTNLSECDKATLHDVIDLVKIVSEKIKNSALHPIGINYLSNDGNIAGQEVMHFHVHVIPKYTKEDGFIISANRNRLIDINTVIQKINSKH